jgi:hypothetical protein
MVKMHEYQNVLFGLNLSLGLGIRVSSMVTLQGCLQNKIQDRKRIAWQYKPIALITPPADANDLLS